MLGLSLSFQMERDRRAYWSVRQLARAWSAAGCPEFGLGVCVGVGTGVKVSVGAGVTVCVGSIVAVGNGVAVGAGA